MRERRRGGFALVELACVLAVVGACLCMALIAGGHSRRLARVGEDLSHLREIGVGTGSHAADRADAFWGLDWRRNQPHTTPWPDLNQAFASDLQAQSAQMSFVVRSRGGRTAAETPLIFGFVAALRNSHLGLLDYLELAAPSRMFVSSGD